MPAQHLYIYYHVYKLVEHDIRSPVKFLMESMRADCERIALRKRSAHADYDTWMEVYEGIDESLNEHFRKHFAERLAQPECAVLRQLQRHEEWFEDLAF
jgi:Domain of unknown function (DUF4936)